MNLKHLIGSGDRIMVSALPFLLIGGGLNVIDPGLFSVGGPPPWLRVASIGALLAGLAVWLWSVVLILRNVPKARLITGGPYSWVRHPLYAAIALLVLPSLGFLLDTWVGALIGAVVYAASRMFAPAEEAELARTFGDAWRRYASSVRLGWL